MHTTGAKKKKWLANIYSTLNYSKLVFMFCYLVVTLSPYTLLKLFLTFVCSDYEEMRHDVIPTCCL